MKYGNYDTFVYSVSKLKMCKLDSMVNLAISTQRLDALSFLIKDYTTSQLIHCMVTAFTNASYTSATFIWMHKNAKRDIEAVEAVIKFSEQCDSSKRSDIMNWLACRVGSKILELDSYKEWVNIDFNTEDDTLEHMPIHAPQCGVNAGPLVWI